MSGPPLKIPSCPRCAQALDWRSFNRSAMLSCSSCKALLAVEVFPKLFEPVGQGALGAAFLSDGEASCFHHPRKQAVVACESCGRFLCGLCDMDLNGKHLCPNCIDTGLQQNKIKDLQRSRVRFDHVALALAVMSWICTFTIIFPVFLAPAAIFISIRYFKRPVGIVGSSRIRFVIALLLAFAQVAMGGWFLLAVIGG